MKGKGEERRRGRWKWTGNGVEKQDEKCQANQPEAAPCYK